jgi:hypothetical protein
VKVTITIPDELECRLCWFYEDWEYVSIHCALYKVHCKPTETDRVQPCAACIRDRHIGKDIKIGIADKEILESY